MMKAAIRIENSASNRVVPKPKAQQVVKQPSDKPGSKLELFEEMILPHLNTAYNLARWLTRNEHDAQDVVQESYLRAFRFFEGYQGGDPKAWLLAIVRNTFNTWLRRQDRGRKVIAFDEELHGKNAEAHSAEEKLADAGRARILRDCIDALPPEYREVLVMRELEEMSYRQIAEVANVPVGTVMSRLSRARRRLEECAGRRSGEEK
jgi:RNA polymerase sigma-70 factor (ECF subfamily)